MSENIDIKLILYSKDLTTRTMAFYNKLAQDLNKTINQHNHVETINFATSGMEQLFTRQVISLLDARAYGYAMNGQRELAIVDAQQIIDCSPMTSEGYLHKALTLTMYGNQVQVIEAYNGGLQNVMALESEQQMYARQLKKGLEEAIRRKNSKRINFITKFPIISVGHIIIPLLSSCIL